MVMEQRRSQIRLAQPSDAAELHKLNELFNGVGTNTLDNIESKLNSIRKELIYVADDGERLIGFCCGHIISSICYPVDYAEITELYVIDECRRHGIGKQLIRFVEERLEELGARHFHILTFKDNSAAIALYLSCGYTQTSETLLEKG